MKYFLSALLLIAILAHFTQGNCQSPKQDDSVKTYCGGEKYLVKPLTHNIKAGKPRNIILMIGDGMGVSHIMAGLTANYGHLFLENFRIIGFSKTQSSDNYITDSAAGATALSTGKKAFNGAIAMITDAEGDTVPAETILEIAEKKKLSTGLVSTSSITHATPASFIAHQKSRDDDEAIAADFLKTEIDVFIGGGSKFFTERADGRNLTIELMQKGYQVLNDMNEISQVKSGKLAGLTAPEHNQPIPYRTMDLQQSTNTAINILSNNKKGFFLMVEGSQIDWGAHQNNSIYLIQEMIDFDKAIGEALEYALKDRKTLVIVTADHETGGFNLLGGNVQTGMVKGEFSTKGHSGVMVPIFAYGPGAELFQGIMQNSDVGKKLMDLLK